MKFFPQSFTRLYVILVLGVCLALRLAWGMDGLKGVIQMAGCFIPVVLGVVIVTVGVASDRRRKEFTDERDHLCVSCGYDRRGLAAEAQCPECGRAAAAG